MSPEQAAGGAVDGRSDQYSLACTLYEMLVGQPPFTGPSAQAVIARHSLEPVPACGWFARRCRPAVEAAIMRAMAKPPADRFASIQRFLDALESPGIATTAPTLPASPPRPVRWRVGRRVMGALGAGALLALAAWWFVAGRTPARSTTPRW